MAEQPPQKKLKRSSILDFFQRKPPSDDESLTPSDSELLPAAEEKEDSLCASDIECQLSPNSTPPGLSPGSTSAFGESTTATPPEPGPGSTSASTHTVSESSPLPLVGPYDLGAIKTSLQRGTLSDGDKYNVLNQLDQPQQYIFPAVVEGSAIAKISELLVFSIPLVNIQQIRKQWILCILFGICFIGKIRGEFRRFGTYSFN